MYEQDLLKEIKQQKESLMLTAEAVRKVGRKLREDSTFYDTWKNAAALTFQDTFAKRFREKTIFEISEEAADNFLSRIMELSDDNPNL